MKTIQELRQLDDRDLIHEVLKLQEIIRSSLPEEAKASQIHNYHFAGMELLRLSNEKMLGSAVILSVHSLSGKVLVKPITISDGFSNNTVNCLLDDLERTYEHKTELKPITERLK